MGMGFCEFLTVIVMALSAGRDAREPPTGCRRSHGDLNGYGLNGNGVRFPFARDSSASNCLVRVGRHFRARVCKWCER